MNLYYIKILGIIIVTMCCVIATYTDVKRQIIPNKLTLTTLTMGIVLVSIYYSILNEFNLFYYFSILVIFILSYVLWLIGVWAGGDVKLFTAISSLFVPEFISVFPTYTLFGVSLPYKLYVMHIPTMFIIFNSIISILPVVLIYISIKIIKDKSYLKDKLKESLDFKQTLLSLNSLIISYIIISQINVYHPIIKLVFLLIFSYIISKIMNYDIILIIITLTIIIQQILTQNILIYILEFSILLLTITLKNIYQKGIIKEALSSNIKACDLVEGMILQYPLYYKDNKYYFDKSAWYDMNDKGELKCSNASRGLTDNEVRLVKQVYGNSMIPIKKAMPFAPFILTGLILTILFGNTYQLFIYIGGLIL